MSINPVRPIPHPLRLLSLVALAACGILDAEKPAPLELSVYVEQPCARYCVAGSEDELSVSVYHFEGDEGRPIEGVGFQLTTSSDALRLAHTTLRTDAQGSARATVEFLRAAEDATVVLTLVDKPDGVILAQDWDSGRSVTYRILAGPPTVWFDRDSIYIVEPGCESEAAWTLMAGEEVLAGEGRPSFYIEEGIARLFGAGDAHTFVKGVTEGKTQLSIDWGYNQDRIHGQIPVRVGPFVPHTFSAGGGNVFLGDTVVLHTQVQGACQLRGATAQTSFLNLSPEVLWLDPTRERMVGRQLGAGAYVGRYGELVDTAHVVVNDYRLLPLDTVIRVGDSFEYRPEQAMGDTGYLPWSGSRTGAFYDARYLSYSSSDTTVAAVREKEAFFALVQAREPGKATITVRILNHHRFAWGPSRTATVTVVSPEQP